MKGLIKWLESKKVNKKAFIFSLFANAVFLIGILSMYIQYQKIPTVPYYRIFHANLGSDSNQESLDPKINSLMSAMIYSKTIEGYKIDDNKQNIESFAKFITAHYLDGDHPIKNPILGKPIKKLRTYSSDHFIGEVIHFKKEGKADITPHIKYFYGPGVLAIGILQPSRSLRESNYYIYRVLEKK